MERLLWIKQLKNDPVDKKIMQTRDAFMDIDNFDVDEAKDAAVDRRISYKTFTTIVLLRVAMIKMIIPKYIF